MGMLNVLCGKSVLTDANRERKLADLSLVCCV